MMNKSEVEGIDDDAYAALLSFKWIELKSMILSAPDNSLNLSISIGDGEEIWGHISRIDGQRDNYLVYFSSKAKLDEINLTFYEYDSSEDLPRSPINSTKLTISRDEKNKLNCECKGKKIENFRMYISKNKKILNLFDGPNWGEVIEAMEQELALSEQLSNKNESESISSKFVSNQDANKKAEKQTSSLKKIELQAGSVKFDDYKEALGNLLDYLNGNVKDEKEKLLAQYPKITFKNPNNQLEVINFNTSDLWKSDIVMLLNMKGYETLNLWDKFLIWFRQKFHIGSIYKVAQWTKQSEMNPPKNQPSTAFIRNINQERLAEQSINVEDKNIEFE